MPVLCEQLAARAFREYMLIALKPKVDEVNGLRAAVLKTPWAEPWNIGAGATLGFCLVSGSNTFTTVPLTAGAARTSAQVAADINAVLPGKASSDSDGRWFVSGLAPTIAAPSKVFLRPGIPGDVNSLFGFDNGGEKEIESALVAPGSRGIADGKPLIPDYGPSGAAGGSPIAIVIDDRHSRPARPGPRGNENIVTLTVSVMRIDPLAAVHRSRDGIHSALRCVRECFSSTVGRQLGRAAQGDIVLVTELGCSVGGQPFQFNVPNTPNPLFDAAVLMLEVKVYEQPGAS